MYYIVRFLLLVETQINPNKKKNHYYTFIFNLILLGTSYYNSAFSHNLIYDLFNFGTYSY